MPRLYVEESLTVNQNIRASKEHKHYLEKVMRLSDTEIFLFNNQDGEFLATYAVGQFRIIAQTRVFKSLPKKALAFGLIKSHRLSWLIEKSCELGVTDLFPLITERVQFSVFKSERYQRILIEAAEQSGRIDLPVVHNVQPLDAFVNPLPSRYVWHFGSLTSSNTRINHLSAAYIIGPEGGFTEKEEQKLVSVGAVSFSMGGLTLRAETAGLWCLSQSQFA